MKSEAKKINFVVFSHLFGIAFYLFVVMLGNFLSKPVDNIYFDQIVFVLNNNMLTVIIYSFFFMAGNLMHEISQKTKYFYPPLVGAGIFIFANFIIDFIEATTAQTITTKTPNIIASIAFTVICYIDVFKNRTKR